MDIDLYKYLVKIRRELHQIPEIGYKEFQTSALISKILTELNIPFKANVSNTVTGIIASLTKGIGSTVILRADIDALPIMETTNLPFASKNDNVMHACGHDVHTAMLVGAIYLLKNMEFNGSIKFVFQPSEEGAYDDPDKKSGGQRIAESDELDEAVAALALHVNPFLEVGKISYSLGTAMAHACFFRITILGRAAHAGVAPELGIDAILISSYLIQAIQSIVSRNIPSTERAVVSITKIKGGTAENIIADNVILDGTIRAINETIFAEIIKRLNEIIDGISISFNAKIIFEFTADCPSVFNNADVHNKISESLLNVFGHDNIILTEPFLAGEDFAFYSQRIPSMFYFIGAKDTSPQVHFLHNPSVIFNENCIPFGSKFLADAAIKLLG